MDDAGLMRSLDTLDHLPEPLRSRLRVKLARAREFQAQRRAANKLHHQVSPLRSDAAVVIGRDDVRMIQAEGAYLVMELIRGSTLRLELTRAGQLDSQTAAEWFRQMIEGVQAAHQAGVIHRDLKPENVLISSGAADRERIKILDFGLARISQLDPSNPQSLTTPGTVMGTFAYMSPEQVLGEEVDERGDVFALGVMAVEALRGCRPFLGRTSTELIAAILQASFHLTGEAAEVEQLDRVLQKCLAKDRRQRFTSVAAMKQELVPAIEHCPPFAPTAASSKAIMKSEDATGTLPMT